MIFLVWILNPIERVLQFRQSHVLRNCTVLHARTGIGGQTGAVLGPSYNGSVVLSPASSQQIPDHQIDW